MARCVGAQGQVNLAKKNENRPPIMTLPAEHPKPKRKKLWPGDAPAFRGRWFEQFSSSTGWRVMLLQNSAKELAPAGLQGFIPIKMSNYTTALRRSVNNI